MNATHAAKATDLSLIIDTDSTSENQIFWNFLQIAERNIICFKYDLSHFYRTIEFLKNGRRHLRGSRTTFPCLSIGPSGICKESAIRRSVQAGPQATEPLFE